MLDGPLKNLAMTAVDAGTINAHVEAAPRGGVMPVGDILCTSCFIIFCCYYLQGNPDAQRVRDVDA